jgi:hypothetical protein
MPSRAACFGLVAQMRSMPAFMPFLGTSYDRSM